MSTRGAQRGALMVIAVIMIVVIGFLSVAIVSITVTNAHTSLNQISADQALYIAEAGIERGIHQWTMNPSSYTGEGPVPFANGSFTIDVRDTDANGVLLPTNQRRITSQGMVPVIGGASAMRTTEVIAQSSGAGFSESFSSISNWPVSGPNGDIFNRACTGNDPVSSQATGGLVSHDVSQDAPGSTGGAFRAQVDTTVPNARLTGYRGRTLAATLPENTPLTLGFWFSKYSFRDKPQISMLGIDLVATDGSVYRVWSDCSTNRTAWTAVTVNWTVPAGKSINRIRIAFDILNNAKAKIGEDQYSLIDELNLASTTTATAGIASWREVIQ